MKDFPIPVVAFGPGSQTEDETLDYLTMPQGMATYRPPPMPEPELIADRAGAHRVLREVLQALGDVKQAGGNRSISLLGLGADDLALVNQVLGEGEVSARVTEHPDRLVGLAGHEVRIQESVFAGVWRVMQLVDGIGVDDAVEVGRIPAALMAAARADIAEPCVRPLPAPLPPEVMNSPMLLTELADQWARWQPGQPPHVINLSLLPMSPADIGFLDHQLGTGRVLILSRGYGNCRITNTTVTNCWRVVYYNSQDAVILNTVEVVDLPEVACAAGADLEDSHGRLAEVLQWVEGLAATPELSA